MDRIVNCTDAASEGIETTLAQLEVVKKALEEKKGDNSRTLRICLTIIYLVGLVLCVIWALMYREISFALADASFGHVVTITAGASSALFFAILILRNLIEAKYYKTIYVGEHNVERINHRLYEIKNECSNYYGLLSNENKRIDCTIDLGEDLAASIESAKAQIESLEKGKLKVMGRLLTFVYYVSAISVGLFINLFIQNAFSSTLCDMIIGFGVDSKSASFWTTSIYGICVFIAVIAGPILSKYYFEVIKLIPLKDCLIFLIAGSGIGAFIIVIISLGLVVAIVALVVSIVRAMLSFVLGIIGIVFIIAIIAGLLSGG